MRCCVQPNFTKMAEPWPHLQIAGSTLSYPSHWRVDHRPPNCQQHCFSVDRLNDEPLLEYHSAHQNRIQHSSGWADFSHKKRFATFFILFSCLALLSTLITCIEWTTLFTEKRYKYYVVKLFRSLSCISPTCDEMNTTDTLRGSGKGCEVCCSTQGRSFWCLAFSSLAFSVAPLQTWS